MKFPTPEGVAATPLRVATWQVYSVDFFSVSMVEMKSFDPLNCLLRKKPTEPPQGYPIGRRRLSCFDKGSASPCQWNFWMDPDYPFISMKSQKMG